MGGLKELLYQCLNQNRLFFKLINECALEGYCFWEEGSHNNILLDAKLFSKFGTKNSSEIELNQLNTSDKNFFKSIINTVENSLTSNESNSDILEATIDDQGINSQIQFTYFKNIENHKYYILVAIKKTNFQHQRSIGEISEILDLAVWKWNLQTNELIVNKEWASIIGYTLEELEPVTVQTFIDVTHPDDGESTLDLARDYLAGKINEYKTEIRFRHKNGSWRWVLAKGKIASRTESG